MKDKIQTRINSLEEMIQLLECIGVDKDFGSGVSECLSNEIRFLKSLLVEQ